jgi:hypothetical protein
MKEHRALNISLEEHFEPAASKCCIHVHKSNIDFLAKARFLSPDNFSPDGCFETLNAKESNRIRVGGQTPFGHR